MSQNLLDDVTSLWGLEAGEFIEYVAEVATPVQECPFDQEIVERVKECHARSLALKERLIDLIVQLGGHPDRPPAHLDLGYYNFARADLLVQVLAEKARMDASSLEGLLATHAAADSLDARLLRQLMEDLLAFRRDLVKTCEKLVAGRKAALEAAAAEAAGETVEAAPVEEETVDTAGVEGDFPWHDEDLSLEERMALAKKGSLFDKLFAAMAQTDCTACGYDCEGYARAIADGEDKDLTKCAPGEEETQEMLESLVK